MTARIGLNPGTWLTGALVTLALSVWLITPSFAIDIQRVKTKSGIEAWLVEDHSIPLIAIRFAFDGGAAQDPANKLGLANLTAGLLDEGAGDLDAQAFQTRMQELAMRLSFNAGKDWFFGRFQTLTRNREQAFGLLKLALTKPRFDAEPINRVRSQIGVSIRRDNQSPERVASRAWMEIALKKHPYALPTKGTAISLKAIIRDDLKAFVARTLVRSGLRISVVGDITAADLKPMLDDVFGTLPETAVRSPVAVAKITAGPLEIFRQMNIPQTVLRFGHVGIKRHDKDFIPAYIINYILGGGGFSSRLTREIRVKRGLTYSVYSYLNPMRYAAFFMGGAATRGDRAGETLALIRAELEKMAKSGPTSQELADAKTYLTGSYALRFDTNTKIAGQLLGIQIEDLGIDYVKKRNGTINAVTAGDVKRTARRLLKPGNMIVTIVGKKPPVAMIKSTAPAQSGLGKPKKPL